MEDDDILSPGMVESQKCVIINEEFESELAYAALEQALEAEAQIIIIEPCQLGDETSRWIRVGNWLHKTAVLSAVGCWTVGGLWPSNVVACFSLGVSSIVCATLYAISWQFDPCCKYQTESDPAKLRRIPLDSLTSTSPIVLIRRDDRHRKRLQNTLAVAAGLFCACRFYWLYW